MKIIISNNLQITGALENSAWVANDKMGRWNDGGVDMNKLETTKKITPGIAVRSFCLNCCGGVPGEVRTCNGDGTDSAFHACLFHPYRMGRGRPSVRTIRKFCLECMGDIPSLVRECTTTDCNCHPYRMGKNPARAGMGGKDVDRLRSIKPGKDAVSREKGVYFERLALG